MTLEQVDRWRVELVAADREWAIQHRTNPLPSDRMATLCRVLAAAQRDVDVETVNARTMLRRLVVAVTGEWADDLPPVGQAQEALRQLRKVEQFLKSLQVDQEVA